MGKSLDNLDHPYISEATPIIIGGCGRSGTTLLRMMLNAHPAVFCGPESNLFLPEPVQLPWLAHQFDVHQFLAMTLAEDATCRAHFIDGWMEMCAYREKADRWAEKTPRNIRRIGWIFDHFPRATFVHVVRDGRDVACSLRNHPRHYVSENGKLKPTNRKNKMRGCINRWVKDVGAGLEWRPDSRYLEVRYEDLVGDTRATLFWLCVHLGLPFSSAMLDYHEQEQDCTKFPQNPEATKEVYQSSVGRWKEDMSEEELDLFWEMAGDTMAALGYCCG